jgi:hypothetical protein
MPIAVSRFVLSAIAAVILAACAGPTAGIGAIVPKLPSASSGMTLAGDVAAPDCPALLAVAAEDPSGHNDRLAIVRFDERAPDQGGGPGSEAIATLQGEAPCRLLIGAAEEILGEAGPSLGVETIAAEYRARTQRRPNPDYDIAREAVREARRSDRSAGGGKLAASGDVGIDLLSLAITGVLQGMGALLDRNELAQAEARLAGTPRTIEEDVFAPYELRLENLELTRRASLPVTLVDVPAGRYWTASVPVIERRKVQLARNLRAGDRAKLEGRAAYLSSTELAALEAEAPTLDGSALLGTIAQHVAARPAVAGTLADAMSALRAGAATETVEAAAAERKREGSRAAVPITDHPSVVRVEGLEQAGHGVYIAPDLVLTLRSIVGGSSLARIIGQEGVSSFAMVDLTGDTGELVLLYSQWPRQPIELAATPVRLEVARDADPGTPLLVGGRLAGLVGGSNGEEAIGLRTLERFANRSSPRLAASQ